MRRRSLHVLGCALIAALLLPLSEQRLSAADKPTAAPATALPPELELVPRDAVGFVTQHVSAWLQQPAVAALYRKLKKEHAAQFETATKELGFPLENLDRVVAVLHEPKPSDESVLVIVSTLKPVVRAEAIKAMLPDALEKNLGGKVYHASTSRSLGLYFVSDRIMVFSSPAGIEVFLRQDPANKKTGPLDTALRTAAKSHLIVAGLNTEVVVEALGGKLPPQAEAFKPMLNTKQAIFTLDLDSAEGVTLISKLYLSYAKSEEAKSAASTLETGLGLVRSIVPGKVKQITEIPGFPKTLRPLAKEFQTGVDRSTITQDKTTVTLTFNVKVDTAALAEGMQGVVQTTRLAAERARSLNNLKQLAVAIHNYASSNGGNFPPATVYSKEGKPLYSWRVLMLPYLEDGKLFKEFHLDEPWDSEHNIKLLPRMPKVFAAPNLEKPEPGLTHYQVFVGTDTIFGVKKPNYTIAAIPDGTSNTILIAEAAEGVPWTKPADLDYSADKPVPKFGWLPEGYNVALADGSVRRIVRKTLSEKTLRNAITANDGMQLGNDW